jgi:hypothetical protein
MKSPALVPVLFTWHQVIDSYYEARSAPIH